MGVIFMSYLNTSCSRFSPPVIPMAPKSIIRMHAWWCRITDVKVKSLNVKYHMAVPRTLDLGVRLRPLWSSTIPLTACNLQTCQDLLMKMLYDEVYLWRWYMPTLHSSSELPRQRLQPLGNRCRGTSADCDGHRRYNGLGEAFQNGWQHRWWSNLYRLGVSLVQA